MTPALLSALLLFCLVTTITPGPNNMMLLASGALFGLRRTLPHILGIIAGMAALVAAVGAGATALFDVYPPLYDGLKLAALGYMLWLAWKIAGAAAPDRAAANARPLGVLQAAGFQWVNPKAWTMVLGAITLYAPERDPASVALVAAGFAVVALPSLTLWALLGGQLQRWLTSPARRRGFNLTMAALLLASLLPVLLHPYG